MKSLSKKSVSTFDRIMKNKKRREKFEEGYKSFLLSETLCELMDNHHLSVRGLSNKSGVSPTIIQELKAGKRKNIAFSSVSKLLDSIDCQLVIKDKSKVYTVVY